MAFKKEIRDRVVELFLETGHIPTVHQTILAEFPNDETPAEITIRKWIEKDKLTEVQKNLHTDSIVRSRTNEIDKLVRRREEHTGDYRKLIEKAGETLWGPNKKEFQTAAEAARALDVAIQGERKISTEQLNILFVEDVFAAIFAVIKDEHVLMELGNEFRKILAKHNEI